MSTQGPKKPLSEAQLRQQQNRNAVGEYQHKRQGEPGAAVALAPAVPPTVPSEPYAGTDTDELVTSAARAAELIRGGYVPAATVPLRTGGKMGAEDTSTSRQEWHEAYGLAGENKTDGIARFPDNYTPSLRAGRRLGGRSLDGDLRGYRTWRGSAEGMRIRTYSDTALRTYFNDPGNPQVHRMPLEYDTGDGRTRMSEAVVAHLPNGSYRVWPGSERPTDDELRACELLTARLEGRRPAFNGYKMTGDLIANARQRQANYAAATDDGAIRQVDSTWVKGVVFLRSAGAVGVVTKKPTKKEGRDSYFVRGGVSDALAVRDDPVPGRVAAKLLRTHESFQGIEQCPSCGGYSADIGVHQCRQADRDKLATPSYAAGPKAFNEKYQRVAQAAARREVRAMARELAGRRKPRRRPTGGSGGSGGSDATSDGGAGG